MTKELIKIYAQNALKSMVKNYGYKSVMKIAGFKVEIASTVSYAKGDLAEVTVADLDIALSIDGPIKKIIEEYSINEYHSSNSLCNNELKVFKMLIENELSYSITNYCIEAFEEAIGNIKVIIEDLNIEEFTIDIEAGIKLSARCGKLIIKDPDSHVPEYYKKLLSEHEFTNTIVNDLEKGLGTENKDAATVTLLQTEKARADSKIKALRKELRKTKRELDKAKKGMDLEKEISDKFNIKF